MKRRRASSNLSLEILVIFEKRTDGKFLYAGPSYREDEWLRNVWEKVSNLRRFQCFKNNFETLKLCHFETWFVPYLRMPSLVITPL
jgi:hypothetical protein